MKLIPPQGTEPGTHFLDQAGREILDPTPEAPPIGYKPQPSMIEHIRNLVRSELLRRQAEAEGYESFEEADDFEVGDDYDPTSPYEDTFEPPVREAVAPAVAGGGGAAPASPPPNSAPAPAPTEAPPAAPPAPLQG